MRKVHVTSIGSVILWENGSQSGPGRKYGKIEQPSNVLIYPFSLRYRKRRDYFFTDDEKNNAFRRIKILWNPPTLPLRFYPAPSYNLAEITAQTCSGRLVRIDSFLWHFPPFPHNHSPSFPPSDIPSTEKHSPPSDPPCHCHRRLFNRSLLILCVSTRNKNSATSYG